jgi:hypothetical protein
MACVLTVILSGYLVYKAKDVFIQHFRNTKYKQVEATVLSTDIIVHEASGTRNSYKPERYEPVVKYQYEVGGQIYTNTEVFPIERKFRIRDEANRINQLFTNGEVTEAYYSPNDPSNSFLIKHYQSAPYLCLQLLIVFVPLILVIFIQGDKHIVRVKKPKLQLRGRLNRYVLKPSSSITRHILYVTMGLCLMATALLPSMHYYLVKESPYNYKIHIATGFFLLVILILLFIMIYLLGLVIYLKEARLTISTDSVFLGSDIEVHITQKIRKDLCVKEAKVGLMLEKTMKIKDRKSSKSFEFKNEHEQWYTKKIEKQFQAGGQIILDWTTTVPAGMKPSSKPGTKDFPKYNWFFEVVIICEHELEYSRKYPLLVQG